MAKKVENIKKVYTRGFRVYDKYAHYSDLTYQILDGLYERTIMNKIIRKYVSSIVPPFYNIRVEDEDGDRIIEIEKVLKNLDRLIDRTLLTEIMKYYFLYGTTIVYKGNIEEEIFLIDMRLLSPKISTDHEHLGELLGFDYTYKGETVFLPLEDLAILANDPPMGEIFGNSIMNHTLDTIHQYLNDNLALAQILDQYSDPILLWLVDVSELQMTDEDAFIEKIKNALWKQLDVGDDIVTDARVTPTLVEFSETAAHLVDILKEARTDLGMLTIPQALLGGPADNLSAIKVQVGIYYEEINGYKAILNDFIVREIYIPYLEKNGYVQGEDFHNIYLNFGVASAELQSDSILWLKTAFELGAITLSEVRATLGFRGQAPGVTEELENYYIAQTLRIDTGDNSNDPYNKTTPKNKDGRDPDGTKG